MNRSGWLTVLTIACALAVGFGLGGAVGQQSPPTENKGLDAKVERVVGVAGLHSHKDRPAFAYVLQGTLTELRAGGYQKSLGPGGILTESRDVEHWAENRSSGKVVLVGVDVIKKQ
jgi:mannose-6-phosphate isomerase-like protein (cupin superfamily)